MILSQLIHTNIGGRERGTRTYNKVHASDLINAERPFCPREFLLADYLNDYARKPEYISTALAYTFDLGESIAQRVIEYVGDNAYGAWQCASCKNRIHFLTKRPKYCESCHGQYEYREFGIKSKAYGFSGSIDLFVEIKGVIYLVEIKSIDKDAFKKLLSPPWDHARRTQLYLWLLNNEPVDIAKDTYKKIEKSYGIILYVMKGFGVSNALLHENKSPVFSPFKEYTVPYHNTAAKLEPYLAQAKVLQDLRKSYKKGHLKKDDIPGKLPERICESVTCQRAINCKFKSKCFSLV